MGPGVRRQRGGDGAHLAVPLQRIGRLPGVAGPRAAGPLGAPALAGRVRFDYDFRVVDSPPRLRELIEERDRTSEGARLVAGYCWDWTSKKDPEAYDIVLPEHDFRMQWNLTEHGSQWLIQPDSLSEIGCIHTCQSLELDYVGVIIGRDLVVRDGRVVTQPEERSKHDRWIRGYKKMLKADPERARAKARRIILNTYRTLMTRGLKGCYVWCVDEETQAWFGRLDAGASSSHPVAPGEEATLEDDHRISSPCQMS